LFYTLNIELRKTNNKEDKFKGKTFNKNKEYRNKEYIIEEKAIVEVIV